MIHEPVITRADVAAIRALIAGTADADQQKRGMGWIMREACRATDNVYQPGADGERDTSFELGRQFVGVIIGNMTTERAVKKAEAFERASTTAKRGNRNGG